MGGGPRRNKLLEDLCGMGDSANILPNDGYLEEWSQRGQKTEDSGGPELTKNESKAYRILSARLNHLSQDNPYASGRNISSR